MTYKQSPKGKIFSRVPVSKNHSADNHAQMSEPFVLICPQCGLIKEQKHWFHDAKFKQSKNKVYKEELCPGCVAVNNKWAVGEIVLKHSIVKLVPEQIEAFLYTQEEKHRYDDPKNRIITIKKQSDQWIVYTTSTFLARQIAEALHGSYQGKTKVSFSKDHQLVRVVWDI